MGGTVGVLEGGTLLHSLIERHHDRLGPCTLKRLSEANAALSWLRSAGPEADVLLIGPSVENAVRIAERAVAMGRGTELLICAGPESHAAIKAEAERSYLLGDAATCLSIDEPDAVVRALADALGRARKRRRYEGLVSAAEAASAQAAPVLASPRAGNVEGLWKYAPIGVLVADVIEGRVLDRNQKAAELLGVEAGAPLDEGFAERDRARLAALLAEAPSGSPAPRAFVVERGGVALHIEVLIAAGHTEQSRLLLLQDVTARRLVEDELRRKLALIEEQQRRIEELSTPIIQVWEGVLCLPVIGLVDAERAARMTEELLAAVARARAAFVVVDLTGVPEVDASTVDGIVGMVRASALLGASCLLSGISARVARAIVELGLDLQGIQRFSSLHAALGSVLKNGR
ncbi:STAS domain-containing protein [Sorangium sp. So ce367]|uniref:STAS domain-containing protein n=1 Tax=Sorangium sp. So ce367 TaxID=3133305 RepID=UPI003F5F96D1